MAKLCRSYKVVTGRETMTGSLLKVSLFFLFLYCGSNTCLIEIIWKMQKKENKDYTMGWGRESRVRGECS